MTVMLYKKGDNLNPDNYRPITLINYLVKVFTQILCLRLMGWAESRGTIPESQAGFRRGRSCLDNLFCLSSILQIRLKAPGSAMYAAFIDFKGAFPSVSHDLLWSKLYSMGLSTQFINIVKY